MYKALEPRIQQYRSQLYSIKESSRTSFRPIRRYVLFQWLTRLVPLVFLVALVIFPAPVPAHSSSDARIQAESLPRNTVVQTVVPATGGGLVATMAFAPDRRMFYTVKGGFNADRIAQVHIVDGNGTLRSTPFLSTSVNTDGERGLLSITLDPNFPSNRYVYIFKTAPASETGTERPSNRVVRYKDGVVLEEK
jgi:glucose/arabinose dehydrogenase